eukprot:COSAG02_NODE_6718_length_3403_cov_1.836562_2_plen_42_part_00
MLIVGTGCDGYELYNQACVQNAGHGATAGAAFFALAGGRRD